MPFVDDAELWYLLVVVPCCRILNVTWGNLAVVFNALQCSDLQEISVRTARKGKHKLKR